MKRFFCIWKKNGFTQIDGIFTHVVCVDIDSCIFYNIIKISKYKFIFSYMEKMEGGKWTIKEYTSNI